MRFGGRRNTRPCLDDAVSAPYNAPQKLTYRLRHMQVPTTPPDENKRLASLRRLQLLDTPAEERFDRITRIARRALGTEIALVSLVDESRQWFKSAQGLNAAETKRDVSFCGHAILGDDTFVVADARADERFADNPLVTGDPRIRLYAGQPLHAPDGPRIGTLCAIDSKPRQLNREDLRTLRDLAILVENELRLETLSQAEADLRAQLTDAERRASVDSLTRVWNRRAILQLLANEVDRAAREQLVLGVIMLDLDHFKTVNDNHGHSAGDRVLRTVASRLRASVRTYDSIGRYGGEEFMIVLTRCDEQTAAVVAERVRRSVCAEPMQLESGPLEVTASLGLCVARPQQTSTEKEFVDAADQALFAAKAAGRNQVAHAQSS
ncbi:MAG: GGDEF domain-containing protein [Planctomycetota bacterium]